MNKSKVLGFSKSQGLPEPKESIEKRGDYIKWGQKNDYPFYLIDMFNGSAWHQGIIKSKTFYISGRGFKNGDLAASFIENKNSDYSIDEIVKSCCLDFEIFDGFAILGTWNREGSRVSMWEYVDFDKLRLSSCGKKVIYSDDWSARKQNEEKTGLREYPILNNTIKSGKFIIYYKSPAKQNKGELGFYPKPTYVGGLTAINTDYLISKYHLYEIQNGFKGGTLINFANGQPETTEEENAIRSQIKGSSTNIEDSNTVVITFSDGNDNAPSVLQLNGNDLADRYNMTEKSVQQNLLVAHNAVNPLLFGIKTEGQLGGATELETSYEIFKNLYVESRQKSLEYIFSYMAELSGFAVNLELDSPAPISKKTPIEQKKKFSEIDKDLSVFEEFGRDKASVKTIKSIPVRNDFGLEEVTQMEKATRLSFDTIGQIRSSLTDTDKAILDLLKKGEIAESISKALNEPLIKVVETIQKLQTLNVLTENNELTDTANDLLDSLQDEIESFEIVYSYEVKTGLGAEIIDGTRPFCRRLIGMNRVYTKDEIQSISNRIGRDVFRYRGGFYNNPDTGRTTPWCRHEWRQNIIRQ